MQNLYDIQSNVGVVVGQKAAKSSDGSLSDDLGVVKCWVLGEWKELLDYSIKTRLRFNEPARSAPLDFPTDPHCWVVGILPPLFSILDDRSFKAADQTT